MKTQNLSRSVKLLVQPQRHQHGPGLTTTDLTGGQFGDDLNPFIVVSLYDMAGPTFPPHPHAGFSVATYILPESPIGFVNQDTLGNLNRIAPGALHVTVAGRGVQHEEQPERTGSLARGFQIWIDHRNEDRLMTPHALHLTADNVPVFQDRGVEARVVLGSSNGLTSPLVVPTSVRVVDVKLEAGGQFNQVLDDHENAFLLMIDGHAEVGGTHVPNGHVAVTTPSAGMLTVSAQAGPARFTLFSGKPLDQTRVQRGPFVASDVAQLQGFAAEFQSSGFGRLIPFSARSTSEVDWKIN